MAKVTTRNSAKYKTTITTRNLEWLADEPESAEGTNQGPTPVEMLLGAISSCMAITMRMYASRKGWPLEAVQIEMENAKVPVEECPSYENKDDRKQVDVITAQIVLYGDLDDDQKKRIVDIGGRCPVHKIVEAGAHFIDEMSLE